MELKRWFSRLFQSSDSAGLLCDRNVENVEDVENVENKFEKLRMWMTSLSAPNFNIFNILKYRNNDKIMKK